MIDSFARTCDLSAEREVTFGLSSERQDYAPFYENFFNGSLDIKWPFREFL